MAVLTEMCLYIIMIFKVYWGLGILPQNTNFVVWNSKGFGKVTSKETKDFVPKNGKLLVLHLFGKKIFSLSGVFSLYI